MAELSPEQAIEKLKTMPEDRQRAILSKLSPEVKKGILGKLKAAPNAGLAPAAGGLPTERDKGGSLTKGSLPNNGATGEGKVARNLTSFEAQLSGMPKAALDLLLAKHWPIVDSHNYKELWEDIKSLNPVMREYKGGDVDWGATAANLLPMLVDIKGRGIGESPVGSAIKTGASKVSALRNSVAPTDVPIAGEKVPVLQGEAQPETLRARTQSGLKRVGIGAGDFSKFAAGQLAKVKEVIRKTAQATSGASGPMPDEPGAAVGHAANVTFDKARPMYGALDDALITVPDSLDAVSSVTKQAIAKAKKLGIEIETGGESVVIDGKKYTPQSDPQAWKNLQEQGLAPKGGQPLSTYMKVRSALLDMKRGATDAAQKYAISKELESMNSNIEKALKDSPLLDDWNEANRLWSKGYALRDVADALRESSSGTPGAQQAPGLSKVPTKLSGPSLVKRLNDLQHEGVLDKAFSQDEVKNLRQSADILDRASGGTGTEFRVGYGLHSTIWRQLITVPFIPIVKAMTTKAGVAALRSGNATAFTRLASGAGFAAETTAGNMARALDGKPESKTPGQQKKDLKAIQDRYTSNPNHPIGEAP